MNKLLSSSLWSVVHDERQMLAQDLDALRPAQWRTPSLCPGWDVHDVLAHVVDTAKTSRLGFLGHMVAAGLDFDRANTAGITREKAADPQDTLNEFLTVRTYTSTPPAALATRLVEAFVHGEDVRRPLRIGRTYPPTRVAEALRYQIKTSVKMGGGKETAQGWRLVAEDTSFEHGDGPEVRGSAISLLLAISGRPVEAHALTGRGASTLLAATGKES